MIQHSIFLNPARGGLQKLATVGVIASLVFSVPPGRADFSPPPFPSFNIVVPTVGAHPEKDNRFGPLHGETHHVKFNEIPKLFDRLRPALPLPPKGEALELSFYLSPMWRPELQENLVEMLNARLQPRFPNNPLRIELHHPRVPRRLRAQMPKPGTDEILLALKEIEHDAPSSADRAVLHDIRKEIETAQPVEVASDEEDQFPRRLERAEQTKLMVSIFATIRALVTGGMFYQILGRPDFDATTKSMIAWSIILSRASIDFGTVAFQQAFGERLAKHELPKPPLVRRSFWKKLNDWYCGRSSPQNAERAEIIKQGVYNYLLFVLLLAPLTQWAVSKTDPSQVMDWGYFGWTAVLCAVATVVFAFGAKGLRKLRQLGAQTGSSIDKKYGMLGVVSSVSDVANATPSLGIVRYFTMGFMALVQGWDAYRAAKAKPKINRYVFVDSWLPDEIRSHSVLPLENVDDTRLFGRAPAGLSDKHPEGEVENFVGWVLDSLPQIADQRPIEPCASLMLGAK